MTQLDEQRIQKAMRELLEGIGVDKETDTYRNTPKRVAKMYKEILSGMNKENEPKITLFKNSQYNDTVILKKIPFYSICAHHLLPFFGDVSVAYVPGDKIVGLSKIPRIVKYFASRLQVQESFSEELADYLCKKLNARGVLVLIKARHLCLEMRGAKAPCVETISSATRGVFETSSTKREEALRLMG